MNRETLLTRLRQEHEHFLETMYPYFGLEQKPEPIKIEIKTRGLCNGTFLQQGKDKNIFIRQNKHKEMLSSLAHESGHYLHCLKDNRFYLKYNIQSIYHWAEFVAELSVVLFLLETNRSHENNLDNKTYQLVEREYTNPSISKSKLEEASQISAEEIVRIDEKQLFEMMLPSYKLVEEVLK